MNWFEKQYVNERNFRYIKLRIIRIYQINYSCGMFSTILNYPKYFLNYHLLILSVYYIIFIKLYYELEFLDRVICSTFQYFYRIKKVLNLNNLPQLLDNQLFVRSYSFNT